MHLNQSARRVYQSGTRNASTNDLPEFLNYDSEYLSPVVVGSQQQTMNVVYSTGLAYLWVYSTGCTNCGSKSNLFNPSLSSTYSEARLRIRVNTAMDHGRRYMQHLASDIISIRGASICQTIDIATSVSSNMLSDSLDGILGLRFNL